MANRRVGGVIFFKIDSQLYQAKGEFTYRVNKFKRDTVMGPAEVHGFSEKVQPPFIEGALTDSDELDLERLQSLRDATVTLELANGKVIVLREAWYAAEGEVKTDEGEIQLRIEGIDGEEVR